MNNNEYNQKVKIEAQDNQKSSVPQFSKVKIEVFTSPTCPHCPHAKKAAAEFAKNNEGVKVVETSTATSQGRKRSTNFGIRSVPTLFITGPATNERIGFVGTPSQSQLDKMVKIALGKENWPEQEKGFFSKIVEKLKIKI